MTVVNPATESWEQGVPIKDERYILAFFSKEDTPHVVAWREDRWEEESGRYWEREPLCFANILDPVTGEPIHRR